VSALLGTQEGSDFYQVMRVLDSIQRSADEPVNLRLEGHVSFGFQSSLMHEVKVVPHGPGGYSYKVALNDYHLTSSKSILPDTFVESVQVSMMDGNAAPKAFLDIFNSELIRSAYKIKKSLDPSLFNLTSSDASYFRSLDALSGLDGRPELRSSLVEFFGDSFDFYSNSLCYRKFGRSYLSDSLENFLGTGVEIRSFAGAWLPIPEDCQLRLKTDAVLDGQTGLGTSHWCYDAAIELVVDCPSAEYLRNLLPSGGGYRNFVKALAIISDCRFGIHLQLKLNGEEIPDFVLGENRLGFDAWFPEETRIANDHNPSFFLSVEELSSAIESRGESDV